MTLCYHHPRPAVKCFPFNNFKFFARRSDRVNLQMNSVLCPGRTVSLGKEASVRMSPFPMSESMDRFKACRPRPITQTRLTYAGTETDSMGIVHKRCGPLLFSPDALRGRWVLRPPVRSSQSADELGSVSWTHCIAG
jgi:hypothetical protein